MSSLELTRPTSSSLLYERRGKNLGLSNFPSRLRNPEAARLERDRILEKAKGGREREKEEEEAGGGGRGRTSHAVIPARQVVTSHFQLTPFISETFPSASLSSLASTTWIRSAVETGVELCMGVCASLSVLCLYVLVCLVLNSSGIFYVQK